MIAEITVHALLQTELVGTTSSSTATRGCMFDATTSGDVGRWAVHPELHSTQVYRCVAGEDADDEERSNKEITRFKLSAYI